MTQHYISAQQIKLFVFVVEDKNMNIRVNLKELREAVRKRIAQPEDNSLARMDLPIEAREAIYRVCQECRKVRVLPQAR